MNKKEFIERLIDMGGCGAKPETWAIGWDDAIGEVIEIANELDEPQKTIIPQFVADWIDKQMKFGYECVFISMTRLRRNAPEKVKVWFDNNTDTYARAWMDGYTVEKRQRWVVKVGKGYFSGYDESKVTYALDNFPGEIAQIIVYDDLNEAESDADDIGGVVEEVTE